MWVNSMRLFGSMAAAMLLFTGGCRSAKRVDLPVRMPEGVVWRDRTFRSAALGRDVTYRVIEPRSFGLGQRARVVYLLHGNGQSYREWSERSSIASLATEGFVFVMPEGGSGYFMNAVERPQDKYEDFVTKDLVAVAEAEFPSPLNRGRRAIIGDSMGGFAAIVLGLKHPEEYGFVGALSPPVDAAARAFSWRRWGQSVGFQQIFGSTGSETRKADDPFVLVRRVEASNVPYVYLGVGCGEPLKEPVERFDRALTRAGVKHEFHVEEGGHNWGQWDEQMAGLEKALRQSR